MKPAAAMLTVAVAFCLFALAAGPAPAAAASPPAEKDGSSAVLVGRVLSTMVLVHEPTGERVGVLARVHSRGYVFVVRCLVPAPCDRLRQDRRVEVRGDLSPGLIDAVTVRRLPPPAGG